MLLVLLLAMLDATWSLVPDILVKYEVGEVAGSRIAAIENPDHMKGHVAEHDLTVSDRMAGPGQPALPPRMPKLCQPWKPGLRPLASCRTDPEWGCQIGDGSGVIRATIDVQRGTGHVSRDVRGQI